MYIHFIHIYTWIDAESGIHYFNLCNLIIRNLHHNFNTYYKEFLWGLKENDCREEKPLRPSCRHLLGLPYVYVFVRMHVCMCVLCFLPLIPHGLPSWTHSFCQVKALELLRTWLEGSKRSDGQENVMKCFSEISDVVAKQALPRRGEGGSNGEVVDSSHLGEVKKNAKSDQSFSLTDSGN